MMNITTRKAWINGKSKKDLLEWCTSWDAKGAWMYVYGLSFYVLQNGKVEKQNQNLILINSIVLNKLAQFFAYICLCSKI